MHAIMGQLRACFFCFHHTSMPPWGNIIGTSFSEKAWVNLSIRIFFSGSRCFSTMTRGLSLSFQFNVFPKHTYACSYSHSHDTYWSLVPMQQRSIKCQFEFCICYIILEKKLTSNLTSGHGRFLTEFSFLHSNYVSLACLKSQSIVLFKINEKETHLISLEWNSFISPLMFALACRYTLAIFLFPFYGFATWCPSKSHFPHSCCGYSEKS